MDDELQVARKVPGYAAQDPGRAVRELAAALADDRPGLVRLAGVALVEDSEGPADDSPPTWRPLGGDAFLGDVPLDAHTLAAHAVSVSVASCLATAAEVEAWRDAEAGDDPDPLPW